MPELFGIGVEIYIILAVLGIPVYFLWRWIFKKSRHQTTSKITIWIATILSTPVLYGLLIVIWIFIMEYYPNRDFDKQQWIKNKDERYEYSKGIIKSKMLMGKTKEQVRQILGDDGNSNTSDDWYYDLGYRPELTGIDPDNLEIAFKNGRVNEVVQNER
jgi:hypothetical protein